MQRGAFEDTAKTAGWQARGFYCRDGAERRSAAGGGAVETACFPPGAVIYSTRRCTTAGGWLHHPKGGAVYAYHITYRTVYRDDHCEKQKPPLCQVTASKFSKEYVHLLGLTACRSAFLCLL